MGPLGARSYLLYLPGVLGTVVGERSHAGEEVADLGLHSRHFLHRGLSSCRRGRRGGLQAVDVSERLVDLGECLVDAREELVDAADRSLCIPPHTFQITPLLRDCAFKCLELLLEVCVIPSDLIELGVKFS